MRELNAAVLDGRADHYAARFHEQDRKSEKSGRFLAGPSYIAQDLYNLTYKDEFDYMVQALRERLGKASVRRFDALASERFTPRDDAVLDDLLLRNMAIARNGVHLGGRKGRGEVGRRIVGYRMKKVYLKARMATKLIRAFENGELWNGQDFDEKLFRRIMEERAVWMRKSVQWPIYFGEEEERAAIAAGERDYVQDGLDPIDPLPDSVAFANPVGANVTNLSAEACIAGLDAVADRLDEGSTAATIRGRTGTQPADPDAAESGTLLFTLTCSDPAVNAGVDDTDGTCSATFDTITADNSADATGTLGYCRFGATGTGVDDHIDGNATTDGSGATDWNTLSIVAGSTVSMTSAVIGQSQGSTAT